MEIFCLQILNSRMTEVPKPSVTGSKVDTVTAETLKAASEKEKSSQLPTPHDTAV